METLILHKGDKGQIADLYRTNSRLSIGRGFSNDLVISDPYVAAEQIVIEKIADQWIMTILDNTNPVMLNREIVEENIEVNSGDILTIGRTQLSIFSEHHQVEKTRKLIIADWLHKRSRNLFLPIVVLIIIYILELFSNYQEQLKGMDWESSGLELLILTLMVIIWSGLWSLAGKLIVHHGHFPAHLLVSVLVLGLFILSAPLVEYSVYSTNSEHLELLIDWIIAFVAFTFLFRFNLFYSTNLKNCTIISVVLAVTLLSTIYGLEYLQQQEFSTSPDHVQTIKPPFAKLQPDLAIDQYMLLVEQGLESNSL